MKFEQLTLWFQKNWKGVLITIGILTVVITAYLIEKKVFGNPASNVPDVSNPNTSKAEADRMTTIYLQYKGALPKDELNYKSIADSIQGYLQTTTFYFSSDLFSKYFEPLTVAEFVAVYYFWGPSREYSGSFFSNPFQGIDDKFGNLVEALKARCFTSDFNKIQQKFQSTGLI